MTQRTYTIKNETITVLEEENGTRKFPTLFSPSKTGKTMEWKIWTYGNLIYRESGYVGMKLKSPKPKVCEARRGTEPWEQALYEAYNMWYKKSNEGYGSDTNVTPSTSNRKATDVPSDIMVKPMLAERYDKHSEAIKFPCTVQPKLDGTRMVAQLYNGQVVFSTRNGKEVYFLDHIRIQVDMLLTQSSSIHAESPYETVILDGECYTHDPEFPQNKISGVFRKKKEAHKNEIKIQYWVFDIVDYQLSFTDRYKKLQTMFKGFDSSVLKLVPTCTCNVETDIYDAHDKYLSTGFEGIIIRNNEALYSNNKGPENRSMDMQKYKEFQDQEFTVVDYKEGTGNEVGCVIWECKLGEDTDRTFDVRPRGTFEERQRIMTKANKFIGLPYTVRYQVLSQYGVPIFPVGIGFRNYE